MGDEMTRLVKSDRLHQQSEKGNGWEGEGERKKCLIA